MYTIYMIVLRVKHVKGLAKTIGLIGSDKISLYFETRFGIHTFFLKSPIDVVVMSKENIVQVIVESLRPNNIFFWNPKYYKVVELSMGTIRKKKIKIGSRITFTKHFGMPPAS